MNLSFGNINLHVRQTAQQLFQEERRGHLNDVIRNKKIKLLEMYRRKR